MAFGLDSVHAKALPHQFGEHDVVGVVNFLDQVSQSVILVEQFLRPLVKTPGILKVQAAILGDLVDGCRKGVGVPGHIM